MFLTSLSVLRSAFGPLFQSLGHCKSTCSASLINSTVSLRPKLRTQGLSDASCFAHCITRCFLHSGQACSFPQHTSYTEWSCAHVIFSLFISCVAGIYLTFACTAKVPQKCIPFGLQMSDLPFVTSHVFISLLVIYFQHMWMSQ